MEVSAAIDPLLASALRPFQALEAQGLASQYERSFKLEPGRLITQRYMLGVRTDEASSAQLVAAAKGVGMPEPALTTFAQSLGGASTVLFGFEAVEPPDPAGHGPVFKVYAEYRSRLIGRSPDEPPVELFRGFKWQPERQDAGLQTVYWCRPGLAIHDIQQQVRARLAAPMLHPVRRAVDAVLAQALAANPACRPQWLELGEADQPIRAFDLNLYDVRMRVTDIARALTMLASDFNIPSSDLARLLSIAGPGWLGHVSAGESRSHAGFLTVYFEPVDLSSITSS